jgi:hypothetical protein
MEPIIGVCQLRFPSAIDGRYDAVCSVYAVVFKKTHAAVSINALSDKGFQRIAMKIATDIY